MVIFPTPTFPRVVFECRNRFLKNARDRQQRRLVYRPRREDRPDVPVVHRPPAPVPLVARGLDLNDPRFQVVTNICDRKFFIQMSTVVYYASHKHNFFLRNGERVRVELCRAQAGSRNTIPTG